MLRPPRSAILRLPLAALCIAPLLLGACSVFYRTALVGSPFNRAWSIEGGAMMARWFVPGPDGSTSGFGNPGWSIRARSSAAIYLVPRIDRSGAPRSATIPLWPLAAAGVLLARWCLRSRPPAASCPRCGYPRDGLPARAACPECGPAPGFLHWVRVRVVPPATA